MKIKNFKGSLAVLGFALAMAPGAMAQSQLCKEKKANATSIYNQCKAMGKDAPGYEDCKARFKKAESEEVKACQVGTGVDDVIKMSENLLASCGSDQDRCGAALYELGTSWRKKEEATVVACEDEYAKKYQKWTDIGKRGPEPTRCVKDVSKSLGYYKRYLTEIKKAPIDRKAAAAYQIANILNSQGQEEEAYRYFRLVADTMQENIFTGRSWLMVAEYHYNNRFNKEQAHLKHKQQAIDAYLKVMSYESKPEQKVGSPQMTATLYHLGETYSDKGDMESAAKYFFMYVEGSDAGKYMKDYRAGALEYMAGCFADMENGVDEAEKFLRKKNVTYADSLYYWVGEKNFKRDKLDQASYSFKRMLEINPTFAWAPKADLRLLDILDTRKKEDEAQERRKKVVTLYGPGTRWYEANKGNPQIIEEGRKMIRDAYYQIPAYHYNKAYVLDSTGDSSGANKHWTMAIEGYKNFQKTYPEPSWDAYSIVSLLAFAYDKVDDFRSSAETFKQIALADTAKFGRRNTEEQLYLVHPDTAAFNAVKEANFYRIQQLSTAREVAKQQFKDSAEIEKAARKAAYTQPSTEFYLDYIAWYRAKWGKDKSNQDAAYLAYDAAQVHYEAEQYAKAIEVLQEVKATYPEHKEIKEIRLKLANALWQNKDYDRSVAEYRDVRSKVAVKDTAEIRKIDATIALVMFSKAENSAKSGDHAASAQQYMAVFKEYPKDADANRAYLNAAEQYTKAGQKAEAADLLVKYRTVFNRESKSVMALLQAAELYKEMGNRLKTAETYLLVPQEFAADSQAFALIDAAAREYDTIANNAVAAKEKAKRDSATYKKYKVTAAETFLKAEGFAEKFSAANIKNVPMLVYAACRRYEDAGRIDDAIGCNTRILDKYKNSSFAIDAAQSIPIAYEKGGRYEQAAKGFERFAAEFPNEGPRLVEVFYKTAKSYEKLTNMAKRDANFELTIKQHEKYGDAAGVEPAMASEAAYMIGEKSRDSLKKFAFKSTTKEIKAMATKMNAFVQQSQGYFSKTVSFGSPKWMFRGLNQSGELYLLLADKFENQEITDLPPTEVAGFKLVRSASGMPYYDAARKLFYKNVQVAREQSFYNADVRFAEDKLLELAYNAGQTYEKQAQAYLEFPMEDTAKQTAKYYQNILLSQWAEVFPTAEDAPLAEAKKLYVEMVKADLKSAGDSVKLLAAPMYNYCLERAKEFGLVNAQVEKCRVSLKEVDPTNALIAATWDKYDVSKLFFDKDYNANKKRIENLMAAKEEDIAQADRLEAMEEMVNKAKAEKAKLQTELEALKERVEQDRARKAKIEAEAAAAKAAAEAAANQVAPVAPAATPAVP